jgi:hypothetical protein
VSRADEFDELLGDGRRAAPLSTIAVMLHDVAENEPELHERIMEAIHDRRIPARVVAAAMVQMCGGDVSMQMVQRWRSANPV